jgi:hypothetical protein
MPESAEVVPDWLRSKPGRYYCHSCITENTGVVTSAQASQIERPLAEAPNDWRYMSTTCDGCGRSRKCIKFLGP